MEQFKIGDRRWCVHNGDAVFYPDTSGATTDDCELCEWDGAKWVPVEGQP